MYMVIRTCCVHAVHAVYMLYMLCTCCTCCEHAVHANNNNACGVHAVTYRVHTMYMLCIPYLLCTCCACCVHAVPAVCMLLGVHAAHAVTVHAVRLCACSVRAVCMQCTCCTCCHHQQQHQQHQSRNHGNLCTVKIFAKSRSPVALRRPAVQVRAAHDDVQHVHMHVTWHDIIHNVILFEYVPYYARTDYLNIYTTSYLICMDIYKWSSGK